MLGRAQVFLRKTCDQDITHDLVNLVVCTKERGLCPPRSHCESFVGGGLLRLVEGRRLFGLSKLCLWVWATGYPKNATGLNKRHWFYMLYNYIHIIYIYIDRCIEILYTFDHIRHCGSGDSHFQT